MSAWTGSLGLGQTLPAWADQNQFMWGFASSSYQHEDPDVATHDPLHFQTDWDLFYTSRGQAAPRRNAIYGWSNFAKEVQALKQVGATHYRFSVEWARVEPKPGVYNQAALAEYVRRAHQLVANGITPVVGIWHFTFPDWASDLKHPERHGWLNPTLKKRWAPFVSRLVQAMGPSVKLYAPQNEVNNVARGGYLFGIFPPGRRLDIRLFHASMDSAAELFKLSARLIRKSNPAAKVISVQNIFAWDEPLPVALGPYIHDFNFRFLDRVAPSLDYLGFNYYTKEPAGPIAGLQMLFRAGKQRYTDLGWPIKPKGLYQVAKELYWRYRLPLIVTENGIADASDCKRPGFVIDHLRNLKRLEAEGIPILGYFYWSLADNYEWGLGFSARFGIFSFDPVSRNLLPKPSERFFRQTIRRGWDAITPNMQLPRMTCPGPELEASEGRQPASGG
ncbi:MAG: family 1 glycosylhydrolase [Candidatus Sericytochromatia bacterium]